MVQKRNKLSTIAKVYVGVLSMLGFSSCNNNNPFEPVCEYGTPHADQLIKGKVVSSEKPKKGIENIQLILKKPESSFGDTIYSKADGSFELKRSGFSAEEKFLLEVKDIDGKQNGLYENKTLNIQLKQTKKGDGNWFRGVGEANVTIPLKPKK